MIIYPYKKGSESAKALANVLGVKQIKKGGSKFVGGPNKLVINWGNSVSTAEVDKCMVINKPEAVALCSDKLKFLNHIQKCNEVGQSYVNIPDFCTNTRRATSWIQAGYPVVCRTVLNGHSGEGIVIAEKVDQLVPAPLYTIYQRKKSEFRVHVFNGVVVDVQRKARDVNVPDDKINWKIRNHQFGFIFVRDEDVENVPRGVLTNALNAVKMCGLDFGAVDVIYNQRNDAPYVLEINTAPGLVGTTLEGYEQRFKEVGDKWKAAQAGGINFADVLARIRAGNREPQVVIDEIGHPWAVPPVPRAEY